MQSGLVVALALSASEYFDCECQGYCCLMNVYIHTVQIYYNLYKELLKMINRLE